VIAREPLATGGNIDGGWESRIQASMVFRLNPKLKRSSQMKKYFKLLSAALFSLFFNQIVFAATGANADVVDTAARTQNLSTLVKAIKAAGLAPTLKGDGPFTLFAPTNAAFAKLPKGTLDNLLKDRTQLLAILTYHVIRAKVPETDMNRPLPTMQGQAVSLIKNGSVVRVNNITVIKKGMVASNGVIYEIGTVLIPPAQLMPVPVTRANQ
jgi:uncharacterized surface protein with fasciclin (FAS1) repeats